MDKFAKSPWEVREINAKLLFVLKQIISDLPTNRDWLNPDIERMAKEIIWKAEGVRRNESNS